jgi:hypothetical protein
LDPFEIEKLEKEESPMEYKDMTEEDEIMVN